VVEKLMRGVKVANVKYLGAILAVIVICLVIVRMFVCFIFSEFMGGKE